MGDTVPLLGSLCRRGASGGGPSSVWESVPLAQASGSPADTGSISGSGTDGNHLLTCWSERRGGERFAALLVSACEPSGVSGVVVDDSAFHPARHRDDLPTDVAGENVGGEHDDLGSDILGLADLAQSHRA